MHPFTQPTQQRIRIAIFVAVAVILIVAGALYTGESIYADTHLGETLPPHAPVTSEAAPNTSVKPGDEITVTILITPFLRDYTVTLGVTSTAPVSFTVKPESLSATMQDRLTVTGQVVTWVATFPQSTNVSSRITVSYVMLAPPCNASAQREYIVGTELQEMTNDVMTDTTTTISMTQALIELAPPSCGAFMPLVQVMTPEPTPTAIPTPEQFPVLNNGNLENGPGKGWTEVPAGLIYSVANIPSSVRAGAAGSYVAWLGGVNNATNTLSQSITIPEVYKGKVKLLLRYYTASEEPSVGADTARVIVVSGGQNKVVSEYPLSKSKATYAWVSDVIDLSAFSGPIELRFESKLNDARNSNWFLDDIQLCQIGTPGC